MAPRRLLDVWPEVATELRESLVAEGEAELATRVAGLHFFGVCGCGDEFCQSIRTAADRRVDRTIAFADGGLSAADLDPDGNVVYVEIPHRDDLKDQYRELQGT